MYAIIESGKVVNVVLAESDYAVQMGWVDATNGAIGDSYVDGEFVKPDPLPLTNGELKLIGVEILGVMCSATGEDQNGLTAVALGVTLARMAAQSAVAVALSEAESPEEEAAALAAGDALAFPDTKFGFDNGNELIITDSNFDDIYDAWMVFRQSFFAVT